MLMDDETGELLTTPLMYNEACPEAAALVCAQSKYQSIESRVPICPYPVSHTSETPCR